MRPISLSKLLHSVIFLSLSSTTFAQYTANSWSELLTYSTYSNATVTMAPGEYWVSGDRPDASYLTLSGSNTVYDFSDAVFKIDTRDIAGYRDESGANADFDVMHISGSDITVNGLNLYGVEVDLDTDPSARRYPNRGATYLRISGDNAELNNAHIITAGSNPYGYGDAFGKGSAPSCRDLPAGEGGCAYIGHNKTSGILLNGWGSNAKIEGLDLDMFTFGHGVFVQGYDDIEIRNSTVTGQLFSSNDVINNPVYQEYGVNAYNQEMFPDIMISGSEDGIRYYGDGDNLDWSEGLIIENVEVTNMREAFSLIAARGEVTVNNASAYGNETGFEPGLGTVITNSRADVTNGPLLYYRRDYVDNTNVEIELVGNTSQIGRTWDIAYINGENNVVTLTSDIEPGLISDEAYVRVGQRFNDWRHSLGDLDDTSLPADGLVLNNLTGHITVLGTNGDGVTGYSSAGTVNGGDGNLYDGISLVLSGTQITAKDSAALGNNGTAADGSLETNASIVELGGMLVLEPGVDITNEKLTISGNGIDNLGALYSDGDIRNATRFGSTGANESTIFLDGNASIGVGIAGNQMLIGSLQGIGNFTKRGAGVLAIEKESTFDGSFTVAEGEVVARSNVILSNLTVNAGASISAIGDNAFNTSETVFIYGDLDMNSRSDDNTIAGTLGTLFGSGSIVASNAEVTGNNELTLATQSFGYYLGSVEDNVNLIKEGVGTQVLAGSSTYTGTTTVNEGFLLIDGTHSGGDDYFINEGGTLGGFGTIGSEVIITSGGVLSPGASAGILTVEAVDFQSGSTFEIEIGGTTVGTQFDQLSAADLALGGTLEVSFLNAFTPDANDVFTIAISSNLSGEFENVADGERIQTAGGEGSFLVIYNSSSDTVILSSFLVDTGLLEGDFNRDGTVDAADYTVWRDSFGATGLTPYDGADADGDGQITQLDYNLWVANYGTTSSASTSTAVPEPTSMVLMIMVLAARACKARAA